MKSFATCGHLTHSTLREKSHQKWPTSNSVDWYLFHLLLVSSTPFSSTPVLSASLICVFHGILMLHDAAGEGAGGVVEGAARGSGGWTGESGKAYQRAHWWVQNLGLASAYKDPQSDPNKFFRRVISLPFVPVRYIRMAWGCLVANMPNGQAYADFVDYFEQTWLNGNFSFSKWNVRLLDGPRTNNNLEGWHSRVKTLAGKADIATVGGVDETGVDKTSSRRNRSRRNRIRRNRIRRNRIRRNRSRRNRSRRNRIRRNQ